MVGSLIGIFITISGLILLIVGIIKRKKAKVISSSSNRNQIPSEEIVHDPTTEQEIKYNTFSENRIENVAIDEDDDDADEKEEKSKEYENEKIHCRYCGKLRPIETEYCARCGRSTISNSENMKKRIICNSLVSEDSNFCSNCGKEF